MLDDRGPHLPDRRDPLPLWAQVLQDLRRRLEAGELVDVFPGDRELMEQYGVSRHTIREAVRRLHEAGVLERGRGRGTFVRSPDLVQPVGTLYSLFRSTEEQGFEQRSEVLVLEEGTDAVAAAALGLAPGAALVHLWRLRHADDDPIAVDEIWLPAAVARPLLGSDFTRTSLYAELAERCGVRPAGGWEQVRPALASANERRLLGIGTRDPVFLVERRTDHVGGPLEWRRTVIRGDRYVFVTRWSPSSSVASGFAPA